MPSRETTYDRTDPPVNTFRLEWFVECYLIYDGRPAVITSGGFRSRDDAEAFAAEALKKPAVFGFSFRLEWN